MTRTIVAASPMYGHVAPMCAIAADLVNRGDDVTFLTGGLFREVVERSGAKFVALPAEADYDIARLPELHPEYAALEPGPERMMYEIRNLFVKPVPAQHAALQALLAEADGEPVAVLHDSSFIGTTPILLGAPGIRPAAVIAIGVTPLTLSSIDTAPFGPGLPPDNSPEGRERNRQANLAVQEMFAPVQQYAADVVRGTGATQEYSFLLDSVVTAPDLFLQLSIQELEYPRSDAPSNLRFIGALPDASHSDEASLPSWWPEVTGAGQVVVVSQGTVANRDLGELIEPTLEALADLDVLVVAALGREAQLASVPANARVVEFVPFADLLPHTDVLVSNGGYGGVQAALRNGVPMVLAGQTEDKAEVTARTAWTGVAVNLATQRPTPAEVRKAVEEVLLTPSYKENATRLSAEYALHDAFADISSAIREVLAERDR
ncbi:nucleotide disphospho-sugar-binding domain-containing protein [Streptomyces sp. NPDC005492]|uniref:nucleotide disphospho-sugar-binding domain-containing protein n=1 Tax=Streptomyces sp. NPDC005492 TaxID=3156883 RepID=UPI0033B0BFB9